MVGPVSLVCVRLDIPVCHVILLVPRSAVGATLALKHRHVLNPRPSKEFVPLRQFLETRVSQRDSANQNPSFSSQPEAIIF